MGIGSKTMGIGKLCHWEQMCELEGNIAAWKRHANINGKTIGNVIGNIVGNTMGTPLATAQERP